MPELIGVEPGSPEWAAARRQGVTATDIVSVLGLSTWNSAYSLYWRKLGQVPEIADSDRFRLGRELEPYVIARWREASLPPEGLAPTVKHRLYRSSARPWQMATIDQAIWMNPESLSDPADAVLEAKTWADANRHAWAEGPPAAVRAQVLWQMDVMDVSAGHVGVVFLPSGEFRFYIIEHDTPAHQSFFPWLCKICVDLKLMRERGAEFYARLQGDLPPPDIDASAASLAAVKARFGDVRKDKTAIVDGILWNDYTTARAYIDEHTEVMRGYEARIREQVGEAGQIEVGGELVAHHLVYDARMKAHTRHVDMIRRVKRGGNEGEEGNNPDE